MIDKINFISEFKEDPLLLIIDLLTRYFGGKNQFLPNLDELENKKIRDLSEKLKGQTEKETLNNLLEWQDRNIGYWVERGYLDSSLRLLVMIGLGFILPLLARPLAKARGYAR